MRFFKHLSTNRIIVALSTILVAIGGVIAILLRRSKKIELSPVIPESDFIIYPDLEPISEISPNPPSKKQSTNRRFKLRISIPRNLFTRFRQILLGRWLILPLLLLIFIGGAEVAVLQLRSTPSTPLTIPASLIPRPLIDAPEIIEAGDALQVTVNLDSIFDTEAPITLHIVHGIQRYVDTIMPISNTVIFKIPSETIITSGVGQIMIDDGIAIETRSLEILASETNDVVLFPSANNISAYGGDFVTLMQIAHDEWGNVASDRQSLQAHLTYPDLSQGRLSFADAYGLSWTVLQSKGMSGRLRVETRRDEQIFTRIELNQFPQSASDIVLTLSRNCILSDGRDVVEFFATITDSSEAFVPDGTLVTFLVYATGDTLAIEGRALVNNGVATLRFPAPEIAGNYTITATSSDAESESKILQVVDSAEKCMP